MQQFHSALPVKVPVKLTDWILLTIPEKSEGLERLSDYGQNGDDAAAPLVQKKRMVQDFLPVNPTFRGSFNSVSSVAAERRFSLWDKIKTAMRSCMSEAKTTGTKSFICLCVLTWKEDCAVVFLCLCSSYLSVPLEMHNLSAYSVY